LLRYFPDLLKPKPKNNQSNVSLKKYVHTQFSLRLIRCLREDVTRINETVANILIMFSIAHRKDVIEFKKLSKNCIHLRLSKSTGNQGLIGVNSAKCFTNSESGPYRFTGRVRR
jgi:hypothetical protein